MVKKWVIPLLLALPFVPLLLWGLYLPEAAYASLGNVLRVSGWQTLFTDSWAGYEVLSTPLFPIAVGILARLGIEPALAAALLGTLGWGTAALLMWWISRSIGNARGALTTAVLFGLNPWIIATLGQATGWIIALVWLLLNFTVRRRALLTALGALFLLSLFFRPSQGLIWPSGLVSPLLWSLLLFCAGLGLEWLAAALTERDLIRIEQDQATSVFLGLLLLVILLWQGNRLRQAVETRPLAQWSVEEVTAAWLRDNTETGATLLASERVGYLADRETVAASPEDLQELIAENPPDYVVAGSSIPWQMLREAIWFRALYEPRIQFEQANAAQAGREIWAYRAPEDWLGPLEFLNARVPNQMSLLGFQMDPRPAAAGQPLNMALHLQRPAASALEPGPFQAIVRLVSPIDGRTVGEWTVDLPRTVRPEEWRASQVIVEPVQIPLPPDLESAAYTLNLSLTAEQDGELWPFSYNNDVNRLDRIPLGTVVMPWTGSMEGTAPLAANFAQGVHLAGFEQSKADETLQVTLYWQTHAEIDEAYNVFVHVLDENGQLAANHDGPPANGRFPTDTWLPGITVADQHTVPLPADLPPGTYELRTGLYDPLNGTRLPLHFVDQQPVEGDSVWLGSVTIE